MKTGSRSSALVDSILSRLEQEGKTATLVSIDSRLSGIIAMADTVKESARRRSVTLRTKWELR